MKNGHRRDGAGRTCRLPTLEALPLRRPARRSGIFLVLSLFLAFPACRDAAPEEPSVTLRLAEGVIRDDPLTTVPVLRRGGEHLLSQARRGKLSGFEAIDRFGKMKGAWTAQHPQAADSILREVRKNEDAEFRRLMCEGLGEPLDHCTFWPDTAPAEPPS